jgi:tripartite-type tricarboxylate transporter receptor subunit TctC
MVQTTISATSDTGVTSNTSEGNNSNDHARRPCIAARLVLASALFMLPLAPASAESIADHFRGKTIKLIWPGGPGGDRGLYAFPFIKHFSRHVPGNPNVVPAFMPGAGGAIAVNYIYGVAAPDGLTIATPLAPVVIAQATGNKSVKYDVRKLNWIGRIADATRVLFLRSSSGVRSIDDLKRREIVVGSTGRASETFINPAVMNHELGTKFRIVTGYKNQPAVNMAHTRGETDGAFSTWNNISNIQAGALKSGEIRVIVQIAPQKHPALPDVPLLLDLAGDDNARAVIGFMTSSSQMGQSYVVPPGVPAPILATLRKAFDETMKDPRFIADLKRGNIEFNPIGGEQLTAIVARTMGMPKSVIDRYRIAAGE